MEQNEFKELIKEIANLNLSEISVGQAIDILLDLNKKAKSLL